MKKSELLDLVVNIIREKGKMKVMDIFRFIQTIDINVQYVSVEGVIRDSLKGDKAPLIRVKKGLYSLNTKVVRRFIKNRFQLDENVSNNSKCRKAIKNIVNEFNPDEHLGFIRRVSNRMSKKYNLDKEDVFHEAISIAYDVRNKFNGELGNPTTFILNNVANRLRNKIIRELIPSYHKTEYVEEEDGTITKKMGLVKVLSVSLHSKTDNDSELELIDCLSNKLIHNDYNMSDCRPDLDVEKNDCIFKIRNVLNNLEEKEFIVICKIFGINGEIKTLDQIGEELNLTRERVRQIKNKAIERLKNRLHFLAAA